MGIIVYSDTNSTCNLLSCELWCTMERMLAASGCKFYHRVDRSVARPSDAALSINYFLWENTPSEESMCMLSMEEGYVPHFEVNC